MYYQNLDLQLVEISVLPIRHVNLAVADPRGCPTDQNFLNFMQFWENPANLYVGAPQGLAPPPSGNPVSTLVLTNPMTVW